MSTYAPALKLDLLDWNDTAFSFDKTRIDRDKKHCIRLGLFRWETGEWAPAYDLRMDLVASLVKENGEELPKSGIDGEPLLKGECKVTVINGEAKFDGLMFRCLKAFYHCRVRLKVVAADERLRSEHEGLTYIHPDAYLVETSVRKREKKRAVKAAKDEVVSTPPRPASASTPLTWPASTSLVPHAGEALSMVHEYEQLEERIAAVKSSDLTEQLQEQFRLQQLQTRAMMETIAKQQATINNLTRANMTLMAECRQIAAQPTAEPLPKLSCVPQPTSSHSSPQSTGHRQRTGSETAPTASLEDRGEEEELLNTELLGVEQVLDLFDTCSDPTLVLSP